MRRWVCTGWRIRDDALMRAALATALSTSGSSTLGRVSPGSVPPSQGATAMSLFQRAHDIVAAKANKALDAAENPTAMLDYSYEQMLDHITQVRRAPGRPGEGGAGGRPGGSRSGGAVPQGRSPAADR